MEDRKYHGGSMTFDVLFQFADCMRTLNHTKTILPKKKLVTEVFVCTSFRFDSTF